jgi:hypothetical protein
MTTLRTGDRHLLDVGVVVNQDEFGVFVDEFGGVHW